jgi:hypothetical protein
VKTYTHFTDYRATLRLTQDDIASVPQSGPADDAIAALRRDPRIESQLQAANMADVRLHLRGYGAWDEAELADDEASRDRWLWLAICDVREEPEFYSDGE